MIKKIIALGSTSIVILIVISILYSDNLSQEESNEPMVVKGDVIMPTKVSRPGCELDDRCYIPSIITVEKGKEVTWVNEDSAFHSVTSGFYDAPTDFFDSGYLDPFESFTVVFNENGEYDYFCTLHPWMDGKVIVE